MMEVASSTNSIYSDISTSQALTTQNTRNSFDAYLNTQTLEISPNTTKKETFRVVAFLEKYNGFSSLTPTDQKIFKEILSDDKLTMEEMKSLNYEQIKKINDFIFLTFSNASSGEAPIIKGINFKIDGMLRAVKMTDNEDFNKSILETVQTIDDEIESMNFFDQLSDSLGWNDKTTLIPERDVPELRKKSTEENWKITDYKKFIEANIAELNKLLRNSIIQNEDKKLYQELLNNFMGLEKNYNKVNKPKYS